MRIEKRDHARQCLQEALCQVGVRRLPHDHEQCGPVLNDGRELVRLVADSRVVGQRHPSMSGISLQPDIVSTVWREVIAMSLYGQACITQDPRELQAKVSVGKEDNVQATRS